MQRAAVVVQKPITLQVKLMFSEDCFRQIYIPINFYYVWHLVVIICDVTRMVKLFQPPMMVGVPSWSPYVRCECGDLNSEMVKPARH